MNVPWMPKCDIESVAAAVIDGYADLIGRPMRPPIPVEDIIERYLDVRIRYVDFEHTCGQTGILGATYLDRRLICASEHLADSRCEGRLNFTFAHEAGHWVLHRRLVEAPNASLSRQSAILCRKKDAKKPIEWQADYFAACLLMPEQWVREAFASAVGAEPLRLVNETAGLSGPCYVEPCVCHWPLIANAVRRAGRLTNVSKQAVIIRLQGLGLVINETPRPMTWDAAGLVEATA
jgi:hypothetical protein